MSPRRVDDRRRHRPRPPAHAAPSAATACRAEGHRQRISRQKPNWRVPPRNPDKRQLPRVNLVKGLWADFAEPDTGGDLLALVAMTKTGGQPVLPSNTSAIYLGPDPRQSRRPKPPTVPGQARPRGRRPLALAQGDPSPGRSGRAISPPGVCRPTIASPSTACDPRRRHPRRNPRAGTGHPGAHRRSRRQGTGTPSHLPAADGRSKYPNGSPRLGLGTPPETPSPSATGRRRRHRRRKRRGRLGHRLRHRRPRPRRRLRQTSRHVDHPRRRDDPARRRGQRREGLRAFQTLAKRYPGKRSSPPRRRPASRITTTSSAAGSRRRQGPPARALSRHPMGTTPADLPPRRRPARVFCADRRPPKSTPRNRPHKALYGSQARSSFSTSSPARSPPRRSRSVKAVSDGNPPPLKNHAPVADLRAEKNHTPDAVIRIAFALRQKSGFRHSRTPRKAMQYAAYCVVLHRLRCLAFRLALYCAKNGGFPLFLDFSQYEPIHRVLHRLARIALPCVLPCVRIALPVLYCAKK